jgi:hypothetical protein
VPLYTFENPQPPPFANGSLGYVYQRYRAEAQVGFVLDSPGVDEGLMKNSLQKDFIQSLWTDCCLAALARFRNCRVVSFNQDFHRFPKLAFLDIGA